MNTILQQRQGEQSLRKRIATSLRDMQVLQAWKDGRPKTGRNDPSGWSKLVPDKPAYKVTDYRLKTDGKNLYSYGHLIGITNEKGQKVAYDCRNRRRTFQHCVDARRYADLILLGCPTCQPNQMEPQSPAVPASQPHPALTQLPPSIYEQIAVAWKDGRPLQFKNKNKEVHLKTDGKKVWLYDHVIATTWPDGTKVAYNCREYEDSPRPGKFSLKRQRVSKEVMKVADQRLQVCPSCHKEFATDDED